MRTRSFDFGGLHRAGVLVISGAVVVWGASPAWAQVTPVIVKTFDGTEALMGGVSSSAVGGLIKGTDSAVYGVTQDSTNTRCGTVFRLASDVLTVLHEFQGSAGTPPDGCHPVGELVEASDGNLYGATLWGGSHTGAPWTSGAGTIFRVAKDGSAYEVIHHFGPFPYADGALPQAGLTLGPDGNLYGTTSYGGSAGGTCLAGAGTAGTFYQLPLAGTVIVKHHFRPETDGCGPIGNLTLASDGSFLGATLFGGYSGTDAFAGTVFKLTTSGSFSPLFMLPGSPSTENPFGAMPTSAPVEASDGTLYGTATGGGPAASGSPSGTIYKLTPVGSTFDPGLVHGFTGTDGSTPAAALTLGSDNNFYGSTSASGTFSNGTLFKVAAGVANANLYSFAGPSDGFGPRARLLEVSPGLFYGLANGPGSSQGAIFSFTVSSPATTTVLEAAPNTSVFGQSVTLTATVSSTGGAPTGQVEFFDGVTSLGTAALTGGVATLLATTLSVGPHALSAHYLGDGAFLSSTSEDESITVGRANTTTTIASSPNPSLRRQIATVTATVAAVAPGGGTATGQVQFFERNKKLGTANLVNGVASLQIAFAKIGQHVLTATYTGDTNFVGGTAAPYTHNVTK